MLYFDILAQNGYKFTHPNLSDGKRGLKYGKNRGRGFGVSSLYITLILLLSKYAFLRAELVLNID